MTTATAQERAAFDQFFAAATFESLGDDWSFTFFQAGAEYARATQEAPAAAVVALREALLDATAHLAGAASAYRQYAKRHHELRPRADTDALFTTRAADFDKAVDRARAALKGAAAPAEQTRNNNSLLDVPDVQPWSGPMPRADFLRSALRDIAETKSLTATPAQFARALQRMACEALTADAMAETDPTPQPPAAPQAQTPTPKEST